jgi:hypothetical protein
MLLLGALFALFVVGFWLYCLVDVALTPGSECRGLPKGAWIAVVGGTFVIGAVMWLVFRHPARPTVSSVPRGNGPRDPSPRAPQTRGEARGQAAGRDVRPGPRARNGHDLTGGPPEGGDSPVMSGRPEADAALRRHPAGRSRPHRTASRSRPQGPDDDPEFLSSLNRAIHGAEPGDDPASGPGDEF